MKKETRGLLLGLSIRVGTCLPRKEDGRAHFVWHSVEREPQKCDNSVITHDPFRQTGEIGFSIILKVSANKQVKVVILSQYQQKLKQVMVYVLFGSINPVRKTCLNNI